MDSTDQPKPPTDPQAGAGGGSEQAKQKLSRRKWLVEVGETAAALGLGGPALGKMDAPGLYAPSLDHLTHALESDGRFHRLPAGTQTDYARPLTGAYQPQFFSDAEFETVRKLIRVMLGKRPSERENSQAEQIDEVCKDISEWIDLALSQEPAVREAARRISLQHRELAEHYYGNEAVQRVETEDHQKVWRDGLQWLSAQSKRQYRKAESGLTDEETTAILADALEGKGHADEVQAGSRFVKLLKAQVIEGYYTSRLGLEELGANRHSFHAESPGCPKDKRSA
jgi:hypothetical protein